MPLVGAYRAEALPYYGRLIIADPAVTGAQEADLAQCVAESEEAVIGGSRWRVAVRAGQDTLRIAVGVELWDGPPDREAGAGRDRPPDREAGAGGDGPPDGGAGEDGVGWDGRREMTVEFPSGRLALENISAGPVPLTPGAVDEVTAPFTPGDVDEVALPGGPGAYRVVARHRGRERAAALVRELWEADEGEGDVEAQCARHAGLEEYLLRLWPA